MKKGLIAGLIALAVFVCAFFIAGINASEPDPQLAFAGCNLSFADSIYIKYAVKGNDLTGVKLLIWTDPQTDYSYGSQNYVLNSIGTETVSGAQCLVFQYNKLAAKQMGDVIYARAFVEKQGNAYYSEVKKYSVLQYVYNKTGRTGTASTNQKLIDLLEAMLEYGAKAQIYTNYKTNRLVSANYYQVNVVGGTLPDGFDSGLYALGEVVTLTAPSTDLEGNTFSYWENDGENVGTTATLDVTVISRNRTYTAVYGVEIPVIPDPEFSTGLAYTDNGDGTCTITGIGTCTDLYVLIPPSINGLTVTKIGENAFGNQTALTDIVIPATVTSIGRRAFYGCTGLTEFTIPSSVTSIGMQIFFHANNIRTIYYNTGYFPSTESENQFLNNEGIKRIVFGGSCISQYAARNLGFINNVEEVEIVGCVPNIQPYAFQGCTRLTSVIIGNSVTGLGDWAFSNCHSLTSVTIGENVTWIGYGVFCDCISLVSIEIPDSVTTITDCAFSGCISLTSIEIPSGVKNLYYNTFYSCYSLRYLTIGNNLTYINPDAFANCHVSVINYTGTISQWIHSPWDWSWLHPTVWRYSLYVNGELLECLAIPNDVSYIPNRIFSGCTSLISVTISDSVGGIGNSAFANCTNLAEISIPDSVTSIGDSMFYGCSSLTSVTIPDSVTSIGYSAFSNCTSLTEITIPDSVTSIGGNAFYNCASLTDVYYGGTSSQWSLISIASGNEPLLNATLHCYTPPAQMITVTFVDYDGVTVLRQETVEAGTAATPPVAPYRAGYIFDGWSPDYEGATTDIITVAQYTVNTEPTLTVKSVGTASNETVEVKIMLDNNLGILGMQFSVNYDSTALTLTNSANGSAMSTLLFTPPSRYRSGCTFLWEGVSVTGDDISDGEVLILTFEINEATSSGDYAIEITNSDGNAFDNDMNPVELNVINGIVRVTV